MVHAIKPKIHGKRTNKARKKYLEYVLNRHTDFLVVNKKLPLNCTIFQ